MQKLFFHERDFFIEQLIERFHIALRFNADARQVDGGEAQIASATGDFLCVIEYMAHDARTAPHVRHLGVIIAGFIVLQVERGVQKAEIREQTLGGAAQRVAEQVIVRVALVVVDALLDFENLNRENGCFAVAEPRFRSAEQVVHGHSALRRGIRAVV